MRAAVYDTGKRIGCLRAAVTTGRGWKWSAGIIMKGNRARIKMSKEEG